MLKSVFSPYNFEHNAVWRLHEGRLDYKCVNMNKSEFLHNLENKQIIRVNVLLIA